MNKYFEANAIFSLFGRDYMELKKELPIRPSEMGVLNIISKDDKMYTPLMVAALLDVSKPMIANHISILEQKGYITKDFSSDDKRSFYIIPTEKAKELVKNEEKKLHSKLKKIEKTIGIDKFEILINTLKEVNEVLKKET